MTEAQSICVFCGSARGTDTNHAETATRLGQLLAARGHRLVYGGGGIGLMGALADATLAAGGRVTGVIPRFLRKAEIAHGGVDDMIVTDSMHARKARMFALADAFVTLPGGIGTLDETIEIITWRQLALHDKPIILIDDGYWAPLRALIDHCVGQGFARPETTDLFTVAPTPEAALDAIAAAQAPAIEEKPSRL